MSGHIALEAGSSGKIKGQKEKTTSLAQHVYKTWFRKKQGGVQKPRIQDGDRCMKGEKEKRNGNNSERSPKDPGDKADDTWRSNGTQKVLLLPRGSNWPFPVKCRVI